MMYIDFCKKKNEITLNINYCYNKANADENEEIRSFDIANIPDGYIELAMLAVDHIDYNERDTACAQAVKNLKEELTALKYEKEIDDDDRPYFMHITDHITKDIFNKLVGFGVDIQLFYILRRYNG